MLWSGVYICVCIMVACVCMHMFSLIHMYKCLHDYVTMFVCVVKQQEQLNCHAILPPMSLDRI